MAARWRMSFAFYNSHTEGTVLAFTWGGCCGVVPGRDSGLFIARSLVPLMYPEATAQVVMPVGCAGTHGVPMSPPPHHKAHRAVGDLGLAGAELAVRV